VIYEEKPETSPKGKPLMGTRWIPFELMGRPIEPLFDKKPAYLLLNQMDKQVHASAGCNTLTGSFALMKGRKIQFTQLANTKMACPEPVMNNETLLKHSLQSATSYTIREDTLYLIQNGLSPMAKFIASTENIPGY
jgi:heat shock protein HslJ